MADGYDRFENEGGGGGSFVMGLLTGTVLGAGLGMLFAPKAGSELRNQIAEQAGNLANTASDGYRKATEQAGQWADRGRDMAGQLADRGKDAYGKRAMPSTAAPTKRSGTSEMRRAPPASDCSSGTSGRPARSVRIFDVARPIVRIERLVVRRRLGSTRGSGSTGSSSGSGSARAGRPVARRIVDRRQRLGRIAPQLIAAASSAAESG